MVTLAILDETQRSYVAQAACGNKNPSLFDTDGPRKENRIKRAKAICAVCPVRGDCLDDAMANGYEVGIWGGKTPLERGIIPRKRSGK